jgi:hypothetical protein
MVNASSLGESVTQAEALLQCKSSLNLVAMHAEPNLVKSACHLFNCATNVLNQLASIPSNQRSSQRDIVREMTKELIEALNDCINLARRELGLVEVPGLFVSLAILGTHSDEKRNAPE